MRKPILASLLLLASCGDDDECTVRLTATGNVQTSVQTALIEAEADDVICFEDGTYNFTEELSLTVDKVTLRGNVADRTKVVFDFSGQVSAGNANGIHAQGVEDFVIEGMVVRDPAGDGVRVTGGKNITFRNVNVIWTSGQSRVGGAYGLYPVSSENILIDNCEVRGASDAGIYVGQSMNALVRDSHAEGNVAGIEIENTDDAEVRDSVAVGNVTGILLFNLPQLVRKTGSRVKVHGNTIESNNLMTFAEGGFVAYAPRGSGMLVLASDNVEIHDNTFRSNESTAIVVISCETLAIISDGEANCVDPGYDPFVEGLHIHDNTITGNGTMPRDILSAVAGVTGQSPFFDILWDGLVDPAKPASDANKLCIKNNGSASFAKIDVLTLGATRSTDLSPHDCTQPALGGVTVTW